MFPVSSTSMPPQPSRNNIEMLPKKHGLQKMEIQLLSHLFPNDVPLRDDLRLHHLHCIR